jgi:hypothetical protein
MGASSQTLTGWVGGIAAIGLLAIRIIGARRRSAGDSSDGCAGEESPAAVIGAVTSTIAAAVIASTIAAVASTIAASDNTSTIAASDGRSTIAAGASERRSAAATERCTAAATERCTAATTAERKGVPVQGDNQQAKARQ